MPVIRAKKIPGREPDPPDVTLAKFCYYFPSYKFHEARQLPYRRVVKMLRIAQKEYAMKMLHLTQIVAAPHTKKGKGVKKMLELFNKIIEG